MKKFLKRLLLLLLLAFIIIQFFRPTKNTAKGPEAFAKDITTIHAIPEAAHAILKRSCYDCHSNNTAYPWYNNIQPVAWWLSNHIKDGKRSLNFSEFANYNLSRQYSKLNRIQKAFESGEMPLSSYTFIHRNAVLNEADKKAIGTWVETLRDSMQRVYPADSLNKRSY